MYHQSQYWSDTSMQLTLTISNPFIRNFSNPKALFIAMYFEVQATLHLNCMHSLIQTGPRVFGLMSVYCNLK